MVRDPGICPLNDPSPGKDVEAFENDLVPVHFRSDRRIGFLDASPWVIDDFHSDTSQMLINPCLKRFFLFGKSCGSNRQGHPLRSTYKMLLTISRHLISWGRPPGLAAVITGSRIAHSLPVTSDG